ncbi:MAG: hypothetical protein EHM27_00325 [Deltaproteobacteria bacterium]|nr:MAG: hypothetical protein EHM27_00325 [Deltaproteobacteria bacterium]
MKNENFKPQIIWAHPVIQTAAGKITSLFNLNQEGLNKALGDQISRGGTELIKWVTAGIGNVLSSFINFRDPIIRMDRGCYGAYDSGYFHIGAGGIARHGGE